jgi:hypothetical protein
MWEGERCTMGLKLGSLGKAVGSLEWEIEYERGGTEFGSE